jgi:SNF2 family DNA or RNA helicase
MTLKQREKAIQMFRDQKNIRVMVAGLKCGGLGLNLNFANRVIVTYVSSYVAETVC